MLPQFCLPWERCDNCLVSLRALWPSKPREPCAPGYPPMREGCGNAVHAQLLCWNPALNRAAWPQCSRVPVGTACAVFARPLAAAGPAPAANATCRVAATSGVAWRAAGPVCQSVTVCRTALGLLPHHTAGRAPGHSSSTSLGGSLQHFPTLSLQLPSHCEGASWAPLSQVSHRLFLGPQGQAVPQLSPQSLPLLLIAQKPLSCPPLGSRCLLHGWWQR